MKPPQAARQSIKTAMTYHPSKWLRALKKANRAAQDDKEKTEKAAANAEQERQKAEQQKAQQWQQRARAIAATMSQAELTAKINQLDSVLDDLDLGLYSLDGQTIQALSRSTATPRLGLYPVRATSLVSAEQADTLRSTARQVQYQRLWLQRQRDQGKTTLADVPELPEFKQLKGWIVDLATAHLYNSRGIESRATKRCTLGTHGYIKVADTVLQRVVMESWINAVNPDLLGVLDHCHVHHVNPKDKATLAGNTLDHLTLVYKADHAKLNGAQRALTKYFDQLYQTK